MGEFILGLVAIVLAIGVVGYLLHRFDKWYDSLSGRNKNKVVLVWVGLLFAVLLFVPSVMLGRYLISLVVH